MSHSSFMNDLSLMDNYKYKVSYNEEIMAIKT